MVKAATQTLPQWCRIVRELDGTAMTAFRGTTQVQSPRDAAAVLAPRLNIEEVEVFVVMMLNAQHRVTAMQEVTRGLLNSSLVHPREVFRLAIAANAAAIIIAHNHPSGELTPSAEDRAVTEQLVAAGRLLDIPVHDHLILGFEAHRFYSFAEHGLL